LVFDVAVMTAYLLLPVAMNFACILSLNILYSMGLCIHFNIEILAGQMAREFSSDSILFVFYAL
jgi:hypothetical protein